MEIEASAAQIDFDAYASALEFLVARGMHGIIIGGTTGEYYALSLEERGKTFEFAKHVIGSRLPLMAGINATTTDQSIALGEKAKSLGFNAILVGAPYYAQPTQAELLQHCTALDMPIMLYNFPARTGVDRRSRR